jgi:Flp pilus assembly CpaF family ATPase
MSIEEQQLLEIKRRQQIYDIVLQDPKFVSAAQAFWDNPNPDKLIMRDIFPLVNPIIKEHCKDLRTVQQIEFAKYFLDEAVSLGAIEDLYKDPEVTEIIVEDYLNVFFIKDGVEDAGPTYFTSEKHMIEVINRLLRPVGEFFDQGHPHIEVKLSDGCLMTASLNPEGSGVAHFKITRKIQKAARPQLRIVRDE